MSARRFECRNCGTYCEMIEAFAGGYVCSGCGYIYGWGLDDLLFADGGSTISCQFCKKKPKLTRENPELLGRVTVDSGRLVILDPCGLERDKVGSHFMKKIRHLEFNANQAGELAFDSGEKGMAVGFISGDGIYDVWGYFTDIPGQGRKISKVEIILTEERG